MGGMYAPIAKDSESIYYNPAALAFVNGIDWRLFTLSAGLSTQFCSSGGAGDFSACTGSASSMNLANFYGKRLTLFADGYTALVIPYFGIGAYDEANLSLSIHNPPYPNISTHFINDYGYIIGFAVPTAPTAAVGFNFKQIRRWGGDVDLGLGSFLGGSVSTNQITNSFLNKGTGYGIDMAFLSRMEGIFEPNFSIVWHDVGGVQFAKTDGTDAPPRIQDNLGIGFAGVVDLPGIDLTLGAELTHLTQSSEQFGKKVHLGTELSLPFIDLRAGVNQGYTSYGLGLDLLFLSLDAAYYTTELGVYPGQSPDTRIELGLTMDLGFDFNFNLMSFELGAKKRKMKRRR